MTDLINTEQSAGDSHAEPEGAVVRTVTDIGRRIREAREASGLTLRAISDATGVSTSMLSLVERGRTSPSIGTLVAICDALEIPMARLFPGNEQDDAVLIPAVSTVSHTVEGLTRRIILDDRQHGLELSEHVYSPGSSSAEAPTHHTGSEVGIVLDGRLSVQVNDTTYELGPGDAVHFPSTSPHRFANRARRATRAIWLNIHPK